MLTSNTGEWDKMEDDMKQHTDAWKMASSLNDQRQMTGKQVRPRIEAR